MMMTKLPFPTAAMLLALSSFSQAAISSYGSDFNSGSGSLTGFFRETADGAVSGSRFTWDATAGVGGGGGLLVTNTGANNFFYRPGVTPENATSAFDFSALTTGQGFSSSVDFLWSDSSATDQTLVNTGFTLNRQSNALSNGQPNNSYISGSLIRNTGQSTVEMRIRSDNSTLFTTTFAQGTLSEGSWYRMTYQTTMNANGTMANLLTLYAIGADGLATPVQVNSISGNVTNAAIATGTTIYSGYDIRNVNGNGIDAVDNLNVTFIPEPSALALVALGGMALAGRRRRF